MDLQLTTCEVDGRTVVAVAGEVDLATAPQLREHLVLLIADGHHHLVIDLAGVEFMDSTGLVALLQVRQRIRAHDGSLRLVCTRDPLLNLFRITGFDQVFPIYDHVVAAALAAGEARADGDVADSLALQFGGGSEQDAGVH